MRDHSQSEGIHVLTPLRNSGRLRRDGSLAAVVGTSGSVDEPDSVDAPLIRPPPDWMPLACVVAADGTAARFALACAHRALCSAQYVLTACECDWRLPCACPFCTDLLEERGHVRDVTKRYALAWGARSLRLRPAPAEWWAAALAATGRGPLTTTRAQVRTRAEGCRRWSNGMRTLLEGSANVSETR